ncbi:MAG TPA: YebC/PmpR family DNA-binding transcriptional regulator [Planctomycetota bacterium]|nr:YebC/PmpR family DNA-binding transcriptional regulator [Planctomycetota bacterium]
MAGHSHWKSIKHQKGAADAKRSKEFSKFSKAIMIAARDGGGDPKMNIKLQYAIDKARAGNMNKDAIEKAIKKATGELGAATYEELTYEGYAPGGVALLVEILSDNRNRTAPELRRIFDVKGGKLGAPGSTARFFERKGLLAVAKEKATEEQIFEIATEAGAEDIQTGEDAYHITTGPQEFVHVKKALVDKGFELAQAELAYVPMNTIQTDAKDAPRVEGLIDALEDHEDVQNVYSNYGGPQA